MRWLRWSLGVIAVVLLAAGITGWWALRGSLPRIAGQFPVAGIGAEALIERDARGIPSISARTREDLAFATGFAHAQDRFFQMDLARRLPAGELSELFGPVALRQDTRARRFDFRSVARRVLDAASTEERVVIESYARGVNAGLGSLATRPWEYLLLRAEPRAWSPEDSVLVVHSMWWQLQFGSLRDELGRRRLERAAAVAADAESAHELITFLYAAHSVWDTPNFSSEATCVRVQCARWAPSMTEPFPILLGRLFADGAAPPDAGGAEAPAPGSNNWAVAGIHTRSGVALIANDMHLDLGVPAVWYPARLRVTGSPPIDVAGVTLPGTTAIAAGSNGHVAWGFTNSYGDFSDIRFGPCSDPSYGVRRERIAVRGEPEVQVEYRQVGAGFVLDGAEFAEDVAHGECAQVAWLATHAAATNFALLGMERVETIDQALALAPRVGIPGQNAVFGDAGGRIAWTLLGRVPRGTGPDRLFSDVEFRDASDHPRLTDPPVGRLWTANQRPVDGALEVVLGDDEVDVAAGGYDIGARARQIRDRLVGLAHPATEADMLAIQLDSRAVFLARWRDLLLRLIDERATRDAPRRAQFRELVSSWKPEASTDAVGYRLVRTFRELTHEALWHAVVVRLLGEGHELRRPGLFESAGFRLVNEKPSGVTPPGGGDWDDFLLARLDAAIDALLESCGSLADCRQGAREPVAVRHPLSGAIPLLGRFLDMPTRELPGDHHMPRVQVGEFGASQRFAVSPGRESEGYLQLPGGPSGHPLSPFYRSGFDDWAEGRPSPFLPGPAAHVLSLRPQAATP